MSKEYPYDLAVILPVFRVEAYLRECLDSILAQAFAGKLQILLINDCSPDNSGQICQDYAQQFPTIITYIAHSTNQGSAVARNTGLEAMSAAYFVFVDPDDIVPANALTTLYDAIHSSNADLVKGNNAILRQGKAVPANYNVRRARNLYGDDCLTTLLSHSKVRGHPWGKIFRHESLGHIRFTQGYRMAQDLLYCVEVFAASSSVTLITDNVYHYRIHCMGATGKKYHTGGYLWWFKAVNAAGEFVTTRQQRAALYTLKVRTLLQAIREVRKLEKGTRSPLVDDIEKQRTEWQVTLFNCCKQGLFSLRTLVHYSKYLRVRRKIGHPSNRPLSSDAY